MNFFVCHDIFFFGIFLLLVRRLCPPQLCFQSSTLRYLSSHSLYVYVNYFKAGLPLHLLPGCSHSSILFSYLCSGTLWKIAVTTIVLCFFYFFIFVMLSILLHYSSIFFQFSYSVLSGDL